MSEKTKMDIHYRYWIGILLFILILVISSTWFNVKDLADKLSFALTLSSSVLALLAIYITFNFNNLFANNVTRFLNINEEIQDVSQNLQNSLIGLDRKLDIVPKSIKTLHEKLDNRDILGKNISSQEKKNKSTSEDYIEWDLQKGFIFVLNLNFMFMSFLYFLYRTYMKDLEISLENFRTEFDDEYLCYFIGFVKILSSLNICSIYLNNEVLKITTFNEVFLKNLDKWYENIQEMLLKQNKEKSFRKIRKDIDQLLIAFNMELQKS